MAEIPGGMINSVGLQNPGVAAFARESGPWLEQLSKDGCQVICQVAGHSVDEFVRALEMYVELCPWLPATRSTSAAPILPPAVPPWAPRPRRLCRYGCLP